MADYRPLADQAARKYGVPVNIFRALIGRESGWKPDARSGANALGLVQIHMPSHPGVSEAQARDPRFALDWGAKYLASQYRRFGNWRSALAAYNAGPGRVESGEWTGIPETSSYVKNVLADAAKLGKNIGAANVGTSLQADPLSLAPTPPDLSGFALSNLSAIASGQKLTPLDQLSGLASGVASAAQTPSVLLRGRSGSPATPKMTGSLVSPLRSAIPKGSEFLTPDAEGAPNAKGQRFHAALDWFASAGSLVHAPIGGTVVEVKASKGNSGQVFGGVVKVQDSSGRVFVFRHVDPRGVKVGQRVGAGVAIATVSPWTGGSPHAHVEVWKTLEGGYRLENMIDPARIFR